MNTNDVVTVMAVSGEYVGKLVKIDETGVSLNDPRLVTANEQGMGFANGIAMTGMQDPKDMIILQPVFITETHPEVVKAYRQSVSGIITP